MAATVVAAPGRFSCPRCDWRGEWRALHQVEVHRPCAVCGHEAGDHYGTCLMGIDNPEGAICPCEGLLEVEEWWPE